MRRRRLLRIVLTSLLGFVALPSAAQNLENEITPFWGYVSGGRFDVAGTPGSYKLSDADSYGIIVDFLTRNALQVEFYYSHQDTEAKFSGVTTNDPVVDIELDTYEIGGVYGFSGKNIQPYIAGTIGATRARTQSFGSQSDTFFSASFGAGIKTSPNERFGARLEVRLRGVATSSDSRLFCSVGTGGSGCAVGISGDLIGQIETFAGLIVRF